MNLKNSIRRFLKIWTAWILLASRRFVNSCVAMGLGGKMYGIVGLAVGLVVAAAVLPDAIIDITNSSLWTGAPAVVITLGTTVVGIIAVVALIRHIMR